MDFSVCAKALEDEPAKVLVDAVGEVHVEDLGDAGDAGDDDEDGLETAFEPVCCDGHAGVVDFSHGLRDFRDLLLILRERRE